MACPKCKTPYPIREDGSLICPNPDCGRIGIRAVPSQAELLQQIEVLKKEVARLHNMVRACWKWPVD